MRDSREPALWVYAWWLVATGWAYHVGFGEVFLVATGVALVAAEVARWWRRRQ